MTGRDGERSPRHPFSLSLFWAFWLYDTVRLNSKPCEISCLLVDSPSKSMWHLSCCFLVDATLSPSMRGTRREEKWLKMVKLIRELLVIMMLGVVSVGAFAQKKDKDKRPPKEKVVVVTNDRKDNRRRPFFE